MKKYLLLGILLILISSPALATGSNVYQYRTKAAPIDIDWQMVEGNEDARIILAPPASEPAMLPPSTTAAAEMAPVSLLPDLSPAVEVAPLKPVPPALPPSLASAPEPVAAPALMPTAITPEKTQGVKTAASAPLAQPIVVAETPKAKKRLDEPFFTAMMAAPHQDITEKVAAAPAPVVTAPVIMASAAPIVKEPAKTAAPVEKVQAPPAELPIQDITEVKATPPVEPSTQIEQAPTEIARADIAPAVTPDLPPDVPSLAEMTLAFTSGSTALSDEARQKLDTLLGQLKDMPDMRIQIRAFATDSEGGESNARRISLSRALMVRGYLSDKGIKPSRLDVRALGSNTKDSPADRVDLVFVR